MDEIKERLKLARQISQELLEDPEKAEPEQEQVTAVKKAVKAAVEKGELEIDRQVISRRGWQDFEGRISRKIRWKRVWQYVAAAMIPISVFGWLVWQNEMKEKNPVIMTEQIVPGEKRAVLVMANGQRIDLKDSDDLHFQEGKGTIVSVSDTEGLKYKETEAETEKKEESYHTLIVPRGGEYKLQLSDGTRVWLNAGSKLRYPVQFMGKERIVFLEGEAYFEVERDTQHPFVVKTGEKTGVKVLGTQFNVSAYADDQDVTATLAEGKVQLFHAGRILDLEPNEQVCLNTVTGEMSKQTVDASMYTAWKNGAFIFEKYPLEKIMKQLERWYEIETVFTDEEVKEICFDGEFRRSDDFNVVLKLLERIADIHIHIENRKVVIGTK